MKLTESHIQEIENYIAANNVDFIDLKIELLDHLISDVENKINKGFSFENALQLTKQKWSKHFRSSSSIFLGIQHSASKIILKKAVKEFKPFYALYIASYFLPLLIVKFFSIEYTENMMFFISFFLKTFTFLALIYFLFIIYKVSFSKGKTTYRFILKTQYFGIVFLVISQFFTSYYSDLRQMNEFFVSLSFVGLATTYICHHFYKKHTLEIAKNKQILSL